VNRRAPWLLAASLLLAACTVAPTRPQTGPVSYEARRTHLQRVTSFHLEGRVAAAVGTEGVNASLDWTQHLARGELNLRAPLGFGSVQIVRDGDSIELASSRGDLLTGRLAEAELARQLGFALPLDSLRYWVLGAPDPALPAVETPNASGQLTVLEQGEWRVEYAEYRAFGEGELQASLPRRMALKREGVRLRLVVDRWTVATP
jgi:outer membrane lipoprotein LolB